MQPASNILPTTNYPKYHNRWLLAGTLTMVASAVVAFTTYVFAGFGNISLSFYSGIPYSVLFLPGIAVGYCFLKKGLPQKVEETQKSSLYVTFCSILFVASIVAYLWTFLGDHLGSFTVEGVNIPWSIFFLAGCVPGLHYILKKGNKNIPVVHIPISNDTKPQSVLKSSTALIHPIETNLLKPGRFPLPSISSH